MSIYCTFAVFDADGGDYPAPLVYRQSHILPNDTDRRGGSLDLGYIPGHIRPPEPPQTDDPRLPSRFWAKVAVDEMTGCWRWTAAIGKHGYGMFQYEGQMRLAHRVAYCTLLGPVAEGHQLDHLCRVRACVRPDHLEAVTSRVNNLRAAVSGPHLVNAIARIGCIRGHLFKDVGVYVEPKTGKVKCRGCRSIANNNRGPGRAAAISARAKIPGPAPRIASRAHGPDDDEGVWPYLRVSLRASELGEDTVVLDRAQVAALRDELNDWLLRCDDPGAWLERRAEPDPEARRV